MYMRYVWNLSQVMRGKGVEREREKERDSRTWARPQPFLGSPCVCVCAGGERKRPGQLA